MATNKKAPANSRKKASAPGPKRPLVTLLVVVLLITAILFVLEKINRSYREKEGKAPPQVVEKQKMPPRPEKPPVVYKDYTSVPHIAPVKRPRKKPGVPGTMAVIIDDMGSSMQEATSLLAIDVPITFSVIPGLAKGKQVAEAAHAKGEEVMIHIPMEPKGYPRQRLEANGLLLSLSDEEIGSRVNGYFQQVPYAVGVNNHMGSRFTESRPKMTVVMDVLQEKGVFFVDSKTSPASVGYGLAVEKGMRAGSRNVFLDNEQETGYIKKQLEKAADLARRRGSVIAICHPHPVTIKTLAAMLPVLQGDGITFVHASQVVR